MAWNVTYEKVQPYIVKIKTPDGHGTGFFFAQNAKKTLVAVATALHVVEEADTWQKPIKIYHEESGKEIHLNDPDRAVFCFPGRDAAAIIFKNGELPFPENPLPLMDKTMFMAIGVDLAWAGYPSLHPERACLFQGSVSCFEPKSDFYLIDGVAINGVSGGPVFVRDKQHGAEIIGIVSEYWSNQRSGSITPGLLKAHDVSDLHKVVEHFKGLDDAKEKAAVEKSADSTSSTVDAPSPTSESAAPPAKK